MSSDILDGKNFDDEFMFSASRSSGPGGQNVNKVNTRVELRFDVISSKVIDENEKNILFNRLPTKITRDGILIIVSQTGRSQYENRLRVIEKFRALIRKALTPEKKRIRTRPTTTSKLKRLEEKKLRARKKERRKSVDDD